MLVGMLLGQYRQAYTAGLLLDLPEGLLASVAFVVELLDAAGVCQDLAGCTCEGRSY